MNSLRPALILGLALSQSLHSAPSTGSLTRALWTGVSGNLVENLTDLGTYPNSPTFTGTVTSFLGPTNAANNYGARFYGWVHAPVTGNYVFSIYADDSAELWLGSTASPDSKVKIASVPGATLVNAWTTWPEQTSVSIPLVAGKYYFIEGLHKESADGDHFGVGWAYPGQARIIIPGSALSPWQALAPEAADDAAVVSVGGTVGIPVLANDLDPNGGAPNPASMVVLSPPSHGSVTVDAANGLLVYTHTGAGEGNDSFTYRISDAGGLTGSATVNITIDGSARLPLATSTLPGSPPPQDLAAVDAFPGITFSSPLGLVTPPGETNRLFVLEKGGDIEVIPSVAAPTKQLFLDLDAVVNARVAAPTEVFLSGSEQGLLGLAFHPQYASNRRFFVVYSVSVGGTHVQRLSEFATDASNPNAALTNSEKIMIQQVDEAGNHNGGDLHFGADGYLYMSWGDEGNANDTLNNSQTITKDFWSSITRIDVDLESEDYTPADGTGSDDANLRPNSHPAIRLDGNGNPLYEVPSTNPWVGATTFLGSAVTPANVRTEFWAVGLRNPWRMSFDPVTGVLWCGDVGQGAREEIDKIVAGGNYEWAFLEGFATGHKWTSRPTGWTGSHPPVWDYARGTGSFQGFSVTGGLVYRGSKIPSIQGKYIFADYVSGNIWSLDDSVSPVVVQRIAGEAGITGFGRDPSNGEILMADYNNGLVRRLVLQPMTAGFPTTLAATGLFADPVAQTPNPGLVAYDVNLPFWSDHARKRRWFGQEELSSPLGFHAEGNWSFPTGTVWVKHFDLELERGNPATARRLETRVLVRNAEGAYGVSYRWNAGGTVATLANAAGEEFDLSVIDGGTPLTQTWRIPSQAECMTCHSPQAGHALSFRTRQLNRNGEIAGTGGNFLDRLSATGYLTGLTGQAADHARHLAPGDTTYSLEARARSYLAVNCAYCHNDAGTVPAAWDASPWLKLHDMGLVNGLAGGGTLDPLDRLIVPGDEAHSLIVHRAAARNGYTRMPPLGSNLVDQAGVQLLIDWIENELPDRPSFANWQVDKFGPSPGPEAAAGFDADNDGRTNKEEFLGGTDPLVHDAPPRLVFHRDGPEITLSLPALPGRFIQIESSPDLLNWEKWMAPGNDGISRPPGSLLELTAPAGLPKEFYRATFEEE